VEKTGRCEEKLKKRKNAGRSDKSKKDERKEGQKSAMTHPKDTVSKGVTGRMPSL